MLIKSDIPKRSVSIFGNKSKMLTPLGSENILASSKGVAIRQFLTIQLYEMRKWFLVSFQIIF